MIFRLSHPASEKRRFPLLHNLYVWWIVSCDIRMKNQTIPRLVLYLNLGSINTQTQTKKRKEMKIKEKEKKKEKGEKKRK